MDVLPFTCLNILEGYIVCIKICDYEKYFSITAWEKSVVACDAKVKEKQKKGRKIHTDL